MLTYQSCVMLPLILKDLTLQNHHNRVKAELLYDSQNTVDDGQDKTDLHHKSRASSHLCFCVYFEPNKTFK